MTLIDEFRMLADDLYSVEGHNRYASALSKAADEIERLQSVIACVMAIKNSMDGFHNNSEWADGYIQAVKDIADGIRARGDT